ncbi:protein spinster isoform X3 [Anopheles gambiae]|nr:protein spinster isoform X3 [Anopheles gambiae]
MVNKQSVYGINEDQKSLQLVVFLVTYVICLIPFGKWCKRYLAKWIVVLMISLLIIAAVVGWFVDNLFSVFSERIVIGVGLASLYAIAPTIKYDYDVGTPSVGEMIRRILSCYYLPTPVGSALGLIVAAIITFLDCSSRVIMVLSIIGLVLSLIYRYPQRGQSTHPMQTTSFIEEVEEFSKNKTFFLLTIIVTCLAISTNGLNWWNVKYIYEGLILQPGNQNVALYDVSCIFGFFIIATSVGMQIVSYLPCLTQATNAKTKLCIIMLLSGMMLGTAWYMVRVEIRATYALFVLSEISLHIVWPLANDILRSVVEPARQPTAVSFQNHIRSLYVFVVVGPINFYFQFVLGSVQTVNDMLYETNFSEEHSWKLQILAKNYALLKLFFVGVGFIFFLVTFCIGRDRARVESVVPGNQPNYKLDVMQVGSASNLEAAIPPPNTPQ